MKRVISFFIVSLAFFQCNVLEEDPLPEPDPQTNFGASHIVMALNTGVGLINVPGLLSSTVSANEVELAQQLEYGSLSVLDDQYLKYHPVESRGNYEEEIIFKSTQVPGEEAPVLVVVRSDPSLFCVVNEFEPTYLGMPLNFTIKKGETLETDLLDLFCDYQRGSNAIATIYDHPELEGDGFDIEINTQFANLTFEPPTDFTGKRGTIYELCYDLQDLDCLNQAQIQDCPTYPRSCKYFLYTYVEIEVTE